MAWAPTPAEAAAARALWPEAAGAASAVAAPARRAAPLLARSGLPTPTLVDIWKLADAGASRELSFDGWCVALRLVSMAQAGCEPTREALVAMRRMALPLAELKEAPPPPQLAHAAVVAAAPTKAPLPSPTEDFGEFEAPRAAPSLSVGDAFGDLVGLTGAASPSFPAPLDDFGGFSAPPAAAVAAVAAPASLSAPPPLALPPLSAQEDVFGTRAAPRIPAGGEAGGAEGDARDLAIVQHVSLVSAGLDRIAVLLAAVQAAVMPPPAGGANAPPAGHALPHPHRQQLAGCLRTCDELLTRGLLALDSLPCTPATAPTRRAEVQRASALADAVELARAVLASLAPQGAGAAAAAPPPAPSSSSPLARTGTTQLVAPAAPALLPSARSAAGPFEDDADGFSWAVAEAAAPPPLLQPSPAPSGALLSAPIESSIDSFGEFGEFGEAAPPIASAPPPAALLLRPREGEGAQSTATAQQQQQQRRGGGAAARPEEEDAEAGGTHLLLAAARLLAALASAARDLAAAVAAVEGAAAADGPRPSAGGGRPLAAAVSARLDASGPLQSLAQRAASLAQPLARQASAGAGAGQRQQRAAVAAAAADALDALRVLHVRGQAAAAPALARGSGLDAAPFMSTPAFQLLQRLAQGES